MKTFEELAIAAVENLLPVLSTAGSTRTVFDGGDVVVKVARSCYSTFGDNLAEYQNFLALSARELPCNVRIPMTFLVNVEGSDVIVMEKVNGIAKALCYCDYHNETHTESCLLPDECELISPYIEDLSGANVIFDGVNYWIIDMVE